MDTNIAFCCIFSFPSMILAALKGQSHEFYSVSAHINWSLITSDISF